MLIQWTIDLTTNDLEVSYLSSDSFDYDGHSYVDGIDSKSFDTLSETAGNSTRFTLTIIDPPTASYSQSNLENAEFTLKLLKDSALSRTYTFRIESAVYKYGSWICTCYGLLHWIYQGDYPKTAHPKAIFPSDDPDRKELDNYRIPRVFGTAYIPLMAVETGSETGYVLGPVGPTYTVDELSSPREWDSESTYENAEPYTFTQIPDSVDGDYQLLQPYCAPPVDPDPEYTLGVFNDMNGSLMAPLVKFSTSGTGGTSTKTSPADVIAYILEDMGATAGSIDSGTTFASAKTAYASYTPNPLTFNGGFWEVESCQSILASLCEQCDSFLYEAEKIELHVFDATSTETFTEDDTAENSFNVSRRTVSPNDGCTVKWVESGEPQDQFLGKAIVGCYEGQTSVSNPSSSDFVARFISDSQNAKTAATLSNAKNYLIRDSVSFSVAFPDITTIDTIKPNVVITIDSALFGEYDIIIESLQWSHSAGVLQISGVRLGIDTLEDWSDISSTSVTVQTYTPVGFEKTAGPAGADGAPAYDGVDGTQWYSGHGAPASTLGDNFSYYLDLDTSDLYTKTDIGYGSNLFTDDDSCSASQGTAKNAITGSVQWNIYDADRPTWWMYDLGAEDTPVINKIYIKQGWGGYNFEKGDIMGSHDGTNWVLLDDFSTVEANGREDNYEFSGNTAYRYIRIVYTGPSYDLSQGIETLNAYAIDTCAWEIVLNLEGETGPASVFVGEYDDTGATNYYRSDVRRDIVRGSDGEYYLCVLTHTGSEDKDPTGDGLGTYWESFEATYKNIATGLLLTENAIITKTLTIGYLGSIVTDTITIDPDGLIVEAPEGITVTAGGDITLESDTAEDPAKVVFTDSGSADTVEIYAYFDTYSYFHIGSGTSENMRSYYGPFKNIVMWAEDLFSLSLDDYNAAIHLDDDNRVYLVGRTLLKSNGQIYNLSVTGVSGLDDFEAHGAYCTSGDTAVVNYRIQIDGEGAPDTFKWSNDNGSTWQEPDEIPITGNNQTLEDGITIKFEATTGHTEGDYWNFNMQPSHPLDVHNAAGYEVFKVTNDKQVILANGVLALGETTTPSAVSGYGRIYTKSDNKLYFQDGAGNEHEIQFVS